MTNFFTDASSLEQTYWYSALIGSAIFLIIFILTFIGGGDADMDSDLDGIESADDGGVGFQFFTFKNVIAFFTIFGWSGIVCLDNGLGRMPTILISSISGLLMMVATGYLFFWMASLAD